MYSWDRKSCPLYGVTRCPLFRGCLSIEVNGKTVGVGTKIDWPVGLSHHSVLTVSQPGW